MLSTSTLQWNGHQPHTATGRLKWQWLWDWKTNSSGNFHAIFVSEGPSALGSCISWLWQWFWETQSTQSGRGLGNPPHFQDGQPEGQRGKGARGPIFVLVTELLLERWAKDKRGKLQAPQHTLGSPRSPHWPEPHLQTATGGNKNGCESCCIPEIPAETVFLINAGNLRDKGGKRQQ